MLEKNETKRKQYDEIRQQLELTMIQEDIKDQARQKLEESNRDEQEIEFNAEREEGIAAVPLNTDLQETMKEKFEEQSLKSVAMSINSEQIPVQEDSEQQSFEVQSEFAREQLLEEGDQAVPDDNVPTDKSSQKSKKVSNTPQASEKDSPQPLLKTKDYVAATLNAWNNCPGIVKKQLDK